MIIMLGVPEAAEWVINAWYFGVSTLAVIWLAGRGPEGFRSALAIPANEAATVPERPRAIRQARRSAWAVASVGSTVSLGLHIRH
jgi:hypothetical protein